MLTYWLINEDKMKRLTRIESYMSDKQSPTSPGNNNVGCKEFDNSIKCDTSCDYTDPVNFDTEQEHLIKHSNRHPLKRQEHSDDVEANSSFSQNSISEFPPRYTNCVGPSEKVPLAGVTNPNCENHIEMTPLLLER